MRPLKSIVFSLSPKPTLEDARSWSTSFEKLMKSASGRSCFRQFLRTEFSEENMMFWLACEELKKETNKTVVEEKVRQIYEDFISILSPKEVSHREAKNLIILRWMCVYYAFMMELHSFFFCLFSPPSGEFGLARSRCDKPQHAGADLAHVWWCSAADLHADAERLIPPLHELNGVHRPGEEPGGASPGAIDSPPPPHLAFKMAHASRLKKFRAPVVESSYWRDNRKMNSASKNSLSQDVITVYLPIIIILPKPLEQTRTNAIPSISYLLKKHIYIFIYSLALDIALFYLVLWEKACICEHCICV